MASVNFLLRSLTKKNAPFTARLQFYNQEKETAKNPRGLDFVEAHTEIYVFNPDEVKESPLLDGRRYWKELKAYKGADLQIKERISRIKQQQEDVRAFILEKFEEAFTESLPDKKWLQSVVNEFYSDQRKAAANEKAKNKPQDLLWHFENYINIKGRDLQPRTVLKLHDVKNILTAFEAHQTAKKGFTYKILIPEVDEELKRDLVAYLEDVQHYSPNTVAKVIKVTRTICNYATRYGIQLSLRYCDFIKPYTDKDVVYLSFSEIEKIKNTNVPEPLQNAATWLYLSCFLGQRVSDFMRFNKSMISRENGNYFIDFVQEKTGKKMHLLLHPAVLEVLQTNDMNFPARIDETTYNEKIKEVCKLAGITEKITGTLLTEVKPGVWRRIAGQHPKYKLIGSHIGRKSYCTNFYGKIPTPLILEVSGHTEERTLLQYIGKKDNTNSKMISDLYGSIDYTKD
ncbi:site-specific integrase [Chryseobacterium salipaludis]|uniref:phage integrase SAM-like domain-containing protein n=1 Tax=Chryseobacterium TaxID=59732 RepID=UPI001FF32A3B|nr:MULTISPECIES: phage integrase SAM-like domain-containing protein [Chryseobacterium]MCJ8498550.1 site-specific integrase [Chryseobacterium salipaludis]MCX3297125.1 phage integrase SAM-like domain-containing protein [Planobacterium sp. JC490]